MGKDIKGKRKQKLFRKLQECGQWLADLQYRDKHSNLNFPEEMTVKAWFDYLISMKNERNRKIAAALKVA